MWGRFDAFYPFSPGIPQWELALVAHNHNLLYFALYNAHSCFWPNLSGKQMLHFNFLIQFLIYILINVFQGIILHMDIMIAF